jgi:hypothetical protein
MSSKGKKDNFEQPIFVETTILKINIKSTGDLITKEYDLIPFHPNMSDLKDLSNNTFIYFPSFVKITMKDLQKSGVGNDFPKVFMKLDKYIKLIKYVTGPDREEDDTLIIDKLQIKNYSIALAQNALSDLLAENTSDVITVKKSGNLTDNEIITNNIELIKMLFLPVKSHFYILGNDYVIGKSVYNPPYKASLETNKKLSSTGRSIPLAYTVEFELQLLDAANNPDAGDFSKMTCKAKKANIAKDSMEIFGTNFGYVPEKKISTPSILNTSDTTKKRQFSKLQKEWEERNKYIKEPENERERIAQENSLTPLQRKMKEFDKKEEEYKKIPPGWLKETTELDNKYDNLMKDMNNYKARIQEIENDNTNNKINGKYPEFVNGMMNDVKMQMLVELNNTIMNVSKTMDIEKMIKIKGEADAISIIDKNPSIIQDELNTKVIAYKKLKEDIKKLKDAETTDEGKTKIDEQYDSELNNLASDIYELNKIINFIDAFISQQKETTLLDDYKKKEQIMITDKYKNVLAEEAKLPEKETDLKSLENREKDLIKNIELSDGYNKQSINAEIEKVQTDIRKKKADIMLIKSKIDKASNDWKNTRDSIRTAKSTIETEKTKEEKKIQQETVKDDLKKVKKEIDDLKKELIIAQYKEGKTKDYEITKKEKESYDKKDKPIDSYEIIKQNLKNTKTRYLEIYSKLGYYYKIQGEITLLNEDLARFKELKKSFEGEKGEKDKELKRISDELFKLGTNTAAKDRKYTLTVEQGKLETRVKEYTVIIETLKEKEKFYTDYITILKQIPEKGAEEEFKNNIKGSNQENIDTITLTAFTTSGGGGILNEINTIKDYSNDYSNDKLRKTHKKYRTHKKSKKAKKTKHFKLRIIRRKTLRKIKRYLRKHKYTR